MNLNNLNNLPIAKRLGLGFGAVGLMLVLLLAMSTVMLARINDGTEKLVDVRIPAIQMTGRLENENNNIAIALRNMMLNDDAADRQKQTDQIMASRRVMDEMLATLKKTLTTQKGQDILTRMAEANAGYLAGQDQLLKHIAAGNAEQARVFLVSDLRPRLARLKTATAEQIAL